MRPVHHVSATRSPLQQVAEKETPAWHKVAVDLTGPSNVSGGNVLLTVIDLYSRFPEAAILPHGNSRAIIDVFTVLFADTECQPRW